MKAVAQDRYGGREVLALRDLPEPVCGLRDLRVSVRAAALNPSDWNIRSGRARLLVPYAFPLVLGSDFSGVVTEVGDDVSDFAPGDEVFGAADPNRLGALAEVLVVDSGLVARKPEPLSHVDACTLPVAAQTAWRGLFEELRVEKEERLLVLGGAGAVGRIAIQLARARGIEVSATFGERSLELGGHLGAEPAIDATSPSRFTAHGDYDAIFDTVGAPERIRAFEALRRGGRLTSIAGIPTGHASRAHGVSLPWRLLFDLLSIREYARAALRRGRYGYFFVDPSGPRLREIAQLCVDAELRGSVDSVFELDEFDAAFALLEEGRPRGKVVLKIA